MASATLVAVLPWWTRPYLRAAGVVLGAAYLCGWRPRRRDILVERIAKFAVDRLRFEVR